VQKGDLDGSQEESKSKSKTESKSKSKKEKVAQKKQRSFKNAVPRITAVQLSNRFSAHFLTPPPSAPLLRRAGANQQ
jgi:hypothetical protein